MTLIDASRVLFVSALVLLSYFLPFFHLRRWRRLSSTEAAALSFAAGSLVFGAAAFATHALGINQRLAHVAVLAVLFLSILPVVPRALSQPGEADRRAISLCLFFLLLIMLLQAAFPIYIGGFWYFDWWQHYSLSQMYMGKVPHDYLWLGIYNFASRTPLVNLNAAFFLSVFGDDYWVFQIVASILNSVFLLPAYLLCRRLAGEKAAVMISALLFLSPSIVHNTWYPWPKLFAAYFVLLAAHFYLKQRQENYIPDDAGCTLVFVLIWAGFLAHQSSLFSSIVILLDMFFRALRREPRRCLLLGAVCVLCLILIDGVWFAWSTSFFGMKRSFLSYYERPATVGGLSGYLILSTYHTIATICSPLFVYDLAGKQFDILRFFQNLQVLYYNSFAGFGTISVFITALAVLAVRATSKRNKPGYARHALGIPVRWLLSLAGIWCFAIGALVFFSPGFGDALFSHYFNHPQFARKMFGSLFLVAASALSASAILLWLSARRNARAPLDSEKDFAASLLFWMAVAGYAGGIATHHELYIHGMASAGCATSVLLTVLLLARVCSDLSRFKRFFLAFAIYCESLLITWLPLLIIKRNWGWASEKNWQLKEQNSLVFMADFFPNAWLALAVAGLAVQAAMILVWLFGKEEGESEGGSGRKG